MKRLCFRRQESLFKQISILGVHLANQLVIGLCGGIASGKSTVAQFFFRLGAKIVDADRIGHEVLRSESVKSQILQIWGEKVFNDGEVDRKALAKIVFDDADSRQLAQLEAVTHPSIRQRIEVEIRDAIKQKELAIVLDVPLLFEADWDKVCDKIVFVDTNDEIRKQRAMSRGWSEESWRLREQKQLSVAQKKERSSDIVDASTSKEAIFQQLKSLWKDWGLKT